VPKLIYIVPINVSVMSVSDWIKKRSQVEKTAIGVVGGLFLAVVVLLILNSLFLGLPVDPQTYQYNYSNGTSPTEPITNNSVNVHATGVALSNNAYEVTYTETTTYTYSNNTEKTINNSIIQYQINNEQKIGYLERNGISMGVEESAPILRIYENETTAYVHNFTNNSTQVQSTGSEPLVLTNQILLPQKLVVSIPHVQWKAVDQRKENGTQKIKYKPTNVNSELVTQMDSTQSVTGQLFVDTNTNIITYSVTVTGTKTLDSGEQVTVTKTQELDYTVLDESTVPEKPSWASGSLPENNTTSENNTTTDSNWTPPE